MSKAEERAKEAYFLRDAEHVFDEEAREYFIEGYHQAEKDLELTWEDIENIITISYKLDKEEEISGKYAKLMTHYQEVLKRFKDFKKGT